jgi:hypothetical protein
MSRNAEITFPFGDGEHVFRLALGQLEELQEKCDAGPGLVMKRLLSPLMEWRTHDVRETIRLGLIGGGMSASEAIKLTRRYVDETPAWAENARLAASILGAALFGVEDEMPGETEAGEAVESPTLSRGKNGASPSSTETAL